MVRPQARIGLRDAVRTRVTANGATWLHSGANGRSLGPLSPAQVALVEALTRRDCDESELLSDTLAHDGAAGMSGAFALLTALREGNWLRATLERDGVPLLSVCPVGDRLAREPQSAADVLSGAFAGAGQCAGPVVLSRFALLRRDGDGPLLESPLSTFAVRLHDGALLTVLGALATPTFIDSLPVPAGSDHAAVMSAVRVLLACRLVVPAGSAEETDFDLLKWSPHELWFHCATRQGRPESPFGGTYWAAGRFDPLPAAPRAAAGPTIPLHKPDLAEVAKRDPSLTQVLEGRRSVRRHDDEAPLTVEQLGEFLYRTARTRRTWTQDGVELVDRPYPSGGSLHELELYPVVQNVVGIPAGLYRYDGQGHRLELMAVDGPLVRKLTAGASAAAATNGRPQVLVVVTARFGRAMWKYQSMAYALTLKNVGVLFSVMYCVASAMGLAPCALGGGNARLFGRAAGLDEISEASVGEFILGSAPATQRGKE